MKHPSMIRCVISSTALLALLATDFLHGSDASREKSMISTNKSKGISVIQERIGEGLSNIYIVKVSGSAENKVLLWKSFWGRCEAKISPNGMFVSLLDQQRFGQLSPVIVFRTNDGAPIYQTPGTFDHEEDGFSYSIGNMDDDHVEIRIMANEWSEESSRPSLKIVHTYKVTLNAKHIITPSYYSGNPRLQTRVNGARK